MIGIRPGEKLHEVLLTEDESRHALEIDDGLRDPARARVVAAADGPEAARPLPHGFRYSSDTNDEWLDRRRARARWPRASSAVRLTRRRSFRTGGSEISDEDVDAVVEALRGTLITQGPTIDALRGRDGRLPRRPSRGRLRKRHRRAPRRRVRRRPRPGRRGDHDAAELRRLGELRRSTRARGRASSTSIPRRGTSTAAAAVSAAGDRTTRRDRRQLRRAAGRPRAARARSATGWSSSRTAAHALGAVRDGAAGRRRRVAPT